MFDSFWGSSWGRFGGRFGSQNRPQKMTEIYLGRSGATWFSILLFAGPKMAAKTVPRGLRGGSWAVLGGSWAAFGGSWALFGRSWGAFGPSGGGLRLLLRALGLSWKGLGGP